MPAKAKAVGAVALLALVAGCEPSAQPAAPEIRPVRVITIEEQAEEFPAAVARTYPLELGPPVG